MIIDLFIRLNGGVFKLKEKIKNTDRRFLKKIYFLLYSTYMDMHCSYIGYMAKFEGVPFFPHGINGVFISGDSKIGKTV